MKCKSQFVLLAAMALAFGPCFRANSNDKVIYGDDNRVDVYQSKNALFVKLARSTAAQIPQENIVISRQDSRAEIKSQTLKDNGICSKERFSDQMVAARCSGFLVAPDLLVTAGHCVRDEGDCKDYSWVFDYKVDPTTKGKIKVPLESVFACKEIISQQLDPVTMNDYSLIRLDKKVANRSPLSFRKEGTIKLGAPLVVIGHPIGLPTKIADGANVRTVDSSPYYFVANLDTYGGNSGSAVFDSETGVVEGVLVRGESDFDYDPDQGCRISKRCESTGCRGEDVTRITNIPELHDQPLFSTQD